MSETTNNELLVISGTDVRRLLPMDICIELIDRTMRSVSLGKAQLPLRIGAMIPGGNILATMPGYLEEPRAAGAKVIAVYPENSGRGLPSHQGVVVLFDPRGAPIAVVDATAITALRTAAASAVATRALARADASTLAILGTGEQASEHLASMRIVRRLRTVHVWGRTKAHAEAFVRHENERHDFDIEIAVAENARAAVADADIICTTTSSREPILFGEWVKPGAHVNLIGASSIQAREADDSLVGKGTMFVDYRGSALAQAAELQTAKREVVAQRMRGEIGEVLEKTIQGRSSTDEITIYKSLGIAAQDLAAADYVLTKARALGAGVRAPL